MQRALEGLEGVEKAKVSFVKKRAWVTYDPKRIQSPDMIRAVEEAGYRATPRPED